MFSNRMIKYFYILMKISSLLVISEAVYSFKCPMQPHWKYRARIYCKSSHSYFCLYDQNENNFTEICRKKSEIEAPGFKLIVSGSKEGTLQGDNCNKDFYQPFKFSTSGNSKCIFQKSYCNDEGQVLYRNGTNKTDNVCRCDYTRGYDFIVRPKHRCVCLPSVEDCSCYLKNCSYNEMLSQDYECLNIRKWENNFNCSPIIITGQKETSTTIITYQYITPTGRIALLPLISRILMVSCIITVFVFILIMNSKQQQKKKYATRITNNIYELHDKDIRRLRKRNKHFEITITSNQVLKDVETHGFVIISGPPGSGKSAIAYYIAVVLERKNEYKVLTVSLPEEIRKFLLPETKQVFVIDDPVGKYSVDDSCIQRWKNEDTFIKQTFADYSNSKLILTCRSYIYQSGFSRKLNFSPVHCNLLSPDLKFSLVERINICNKYNIPELEKDTIMMYDFFPLLCSIYSKQEDTKMFFVNPYKVLKKEIMYFKQNSDTAFLAISLLVVMDNNIKFQILSLENQTTKLLLNDLCDECGFKYIPSTTELLSTLYDLNGTYVNVTDDGFSTLNEQLFHNLSCVVGNSIVHCLLKYGSSNFLSKRLQLASLREERDELTIMVKHEQEKFYFQRLLSDIRKGYHRDAFTGIQMKYLSFRNKMSKCLPDLQAEDLKCDDNSSTPLHIVSERGYDDLVESLIRLKRDHIYYQDKNKNTPLYLACLGGHRNIANIILEKDNSTLEITNNDDLTPLDAASINDDVSTLTILLKYGANVNRTDKIMQRTALQRACETCSSNAVTFLLTNNADVKNTDINGLNASNIAYSLGYLRIVELLHNKTKINE